jgi:predicted NUDIX family phosphoesterase
MSNPKWEEQILAVEVDKLFDFGTLWFQGTQTNEENVKTIMKNISENFVVKRRGNLNDPTPAENNMEINENYKQPIPYAILRKGNEIFLYKRLNGGGEKRLHDQLSIGVGGHMNKIVGTTFGLELVQNMYRELNEELNIETKVAPEATILGFINDDENEVGRVHIGILVEIYLPDDANVSVREVEQLEGGWVRVKDLQKSPLFENLESWSQVAVKEIKEV